MQGNVGPSVFENLEMVEVGYRNGQYIISPRGYRQILRKQKAGARHTQRVTDAGLAMHLVSSTTPR
jgi:hypothetical protein